MITDANQRILYPVADIKEGTRIRQDYGDVGELADSIKEHGLIHPIVINVQGVLIAGGRRLRAMRDVLKMDRVPITYFEFADEATLRILEREENVRRKSMRWQEEVLSIKEVHDYRSLHGALSGQSWTQRATGELLGMSSASTSYALQFADLVRKGDKEILACLRLTDAIALLVKRRAEESNKLLAKLTLPSGVHLDSEPADGSIDALFSSVPSSGGISVLADDGEMPGQSSSERIQVPLSRMLIRADSIDFLRQLPPESVDHVITDWPYAIDMEMIDQANAGASMDSVRVEHDVDENKKLHESIVPLIFRVLKPNGFFVTWGDYMQWQRTYDLCISAGFKVQRWPLTWNKTHRCGNQAASYNFTKTTEMATVCRKGNATLLATQPRSDWTGSNESAVSSLGHPFAKPFDLWIWLYTAICQRGQTVLDPFAGRGSSTIAALQYGISPLAVEKNEQHHNALVVNVAEWYRKSIRNVEFV